MSGSATSNAGSDGQTGSQGSPSDGQASGAQTAQPQGQQASSQAGSSENAEPAESNTTTQTIWQVQVSGCVTQCQSVGQTQIAEQQSTTLQAVAGEVASGMTSAGGGSQTTTSISQIQIGCLFQCFGTTTTTGAISDAAAQAVQQLLQALASLFSSMAGQPTSATEQSTVDQTSYQWEGGGTPAEQMQSASQGATTVQSFPTISAAVQSVLGSVGSVLSESVNQITQSIWQLQIGCLAFCEMTSQVQQADQSSTTMYGLDPASGSGGEGVTVANTISQLISQVQIGCLFWCYDANEQQTASQEEVVLGPPSASPPSPAPASPPTPPSNSPSPSSGGTSSPSNAGPSGASNGGTTSPPGTGSTTSVAGNATTGSGSERVSRRAPRSKRRQTWLSTSAGSWRLAGSAGTPTVRTAMPGEWTRSSAPTGGALTSSTATATSKHHGAPSSSDGQPAGVGNLFGSLFGGQASPAASASSGRGPSKLAIALAAILALLLVGLIARRRALMARQL